MKQKYKKIVKKHNIYKRGFTLNPMYPKRNQSVRERVNTW